MKQRGFVMLFGGAGAVPLTAKDSAQADGQDFPLVIASMPATKRQRTIAVGVVLFLIIAVSPFSHLHVARVDAFIPVLQTVLCVADLVTAVLLFAQFSIQPQLAILVLASGYICSGSFAFLQTLAFPGAYASAGLIGDGPNTPAWMYVLWHSTLPAAILVYALFKDKTGGGKLTGRSTMASILITVACVFAVIAVLAGIVTTKTEYLPSLYTADAKSLTLLGNQLNLALLIWVTTALAVLVFRRRTILDLWLMVTLFALMPNLIVAMIGSSVRFTVGWYAARGFVLIASCMLLTVLLVETTFLYSRLASAMILQRRERANRFLTVDAVTSAIAHELRTPMGAIALNADTARIQLHSTPPNLQGIDDILKDIQSDSNRVSAIISSIRDLSKRTTNRTVLTSIEDSIRLVLRLLHHDLQINEVSVAIELQDNLPEVHLDSTQLQQVFLNLVKNAIEAMSSTTPVGSRSLRLTTSFDGRSTVLLSIQDSGPGIPVEDRERIFDPFFTTKSGGTGLGLAICSIVVENHGGKLRLVKSDADGSIFELAIPVGEMPPPGS
jgi:signal transduction histidine kinase